MSPRGESGLNFGRAALGAVIVALGVALLASSVNRPPCVDCGEDSPEETAADVAAASAEMAGEE